MNSDHLLRVLRYFISLHEWENVRPFVFDGERSDKQNISFTQVVEVGFQLTNYPEASPLIILSRAAIIPLGYSIHARRTNWINSPYTTLDLSTRNRDLMYADIEIQLMVEGIGTFYKSARNGNQEGSIHYCQLRDKYPSL